VDGKISLGLNPDGPVDRQIGLIRVERPDGSLIGLAANYAIHGTVLSGSNTAISGDAPGTVTEYLEKTLGAPVLFLNGACGDVNPAWIDQRHDEAARVGSIVGSEAARRLQELRPLGQQHKVWSIRWDELTDKPVASGRLIDAPRIRAASRNVAVPLRRLPPPAWYDEKLADLEARRTALAPADQEGLRRVMAQVTRFRTERTVAERLRGGGEVHYVHPEIHAISLGDGCTILGLPGEFFVETGRAIQDAAALPDLLIAGCANHYLGYVVPRHEFDAGGYEAGVTVVDESAEETLRAAAIDLLREVTN
jgi:hypothetical protein